MKEEKWRQVLNAANEEKNCMHQKERYYKGSMLFVLLSAAFLICTLNGCGSDSKCCDCNCGCDGDNEIFAEDQEIKESWYDSSSGLTWQTPSTYRNMDWQDAIDYCGDLDADDSSDWRLPKVEELRSLIRGCPATETGGSCPVGEDNDGCPSYSMCWDDSCNGCMHDEGPGEMDLYWPNEMPTVEKGWFWSSSVDEDAVDNIWLVSFYEGSVYVGSSTTWNKVICVR